jgi:hypothetical protein
MWTPSPESLPVVQLPGRHLRVPSTCRFYAEKGGLLALLSWCLATQLARCAVTFDLSCTSGGASRLGVHM